MKLDIHKPISILINATREMEREILSKKLIETGKIIYFVGNEYSYDEDGNPYGKGVFYSHDKLTEYVSRVTGIQK